MWEKVRNWRILSVRIGSVTGGAISGATASLMTMALGEAYIGIMVAMFKGEIKEKELQTEAGRKRLAELFKEKLQRKRIQIK